MPCLAIYENKNGYDLWHKGWFLDIYKTADDSKPYKRVCATLGYTDATVHALLTLTENELIIRNDGFPHEIVSPDVRLFHDATKEDSFKVIW